jgi:polysaccharide export outer membrane protein
LKLMGLKGFMARLRVIVGLAVLGALGVSGGCSILPTSGPASGDVRNQPDAASLPYAYVPVNPGVVDLLSRFAPRLAGIFPDRRPQRQIRFGVGDIVNVTIFEAAAGGLFIPAEASVRPRHSCRGAYRSRGSGIDRRGHSHPRDRPAGRRVAC